ncbi:hypothetical protein VKT23_020426 [Stygiomarasmius scandens]|uniref:Uncharacterized protein n=1 Tax=Marasmiellus scandens TaxID=2682957 RepID=A0ABR1IJ40_9AGAR
MKGAKERRALLALTSPKKGIASFEAVTSTSIPESEAHDAEVEADTQNGNEPVFSLLRTPSTKQKSSAPRRSLFILEKPQSQSSATLDVAPETTIDMSDFISIPLPPPPPTPLLSPLKTRTGHKLGAPTPASSRTKVVVDTPLLADDEASPGEHCEEREDNENEVGKGKKAMIMRGSGRADEKESDAEDEDEMNRNLDASTSESIIKSTKPPSKTRATPARATSRARSKMPVASSSAIPVSTVSAIPEVVVEEEATGSKPTTTTNRAQAQSKTPAVVMANTTDDEFNDTSVPKRLAAAPAVPKTRRGRSRTAGGTTSGTEDEKKEEYEGAEKREPVVKPKRGRPRKGTTSTVVTPAVPNAIKEEESDSSPSTMKPASQAKTLSGIPKTTRTMRATRATSSSAAPGTAGTAEEDLDVNKENDEAVVTKTRIGRLRKATGSAVKEEVVMEPELGMSTRRTRGVRT